MTPKVRRSPWTPWAGLFAGAAAWFAHQQFGAGANYWDCRFGGPLWTILLALVCGLVAAVGGWMSWTARGTPGEDRTDTRSFAGLVGAATAAIFLMTIAFGTLASLIVPSCQR
jgi:hypothetical protein